jgi:hypothetical protein
VSRNRKHAVLRLRDLPLIDTFTIFGPSDTPAVLSMTITWEALEDPVDLGSGAEVPPPLAADGRKDFVQVPHVTRPGMPAAELVRIHLPEFPAPRAHRLIGQDDATFRHQLFDVPGTRAEAEYSQTQWLMIAAGNRWGL